MRTFRHSLAATVVLAAGLGLSAGAMAANDVDTSLTAEERAPPPPAPQDVYAAVVQDNGNLQRGINVRRARRLGRGEYEVIFNANIRNCIWVASIGRPGTGNPSPGIISTALRNGDNRAIYVLTGDQRAVLENLAFSIIVTCP
jgi:hypothetical protein